MEEGLDRISDLPDNVTDQILSWLPIKDAARTSVLSTSWRYRWEMLQSLVLSHESFPPPMNDQGVPMMDELAKAIDRLLLIHSCPLLKFELSYRTLSFPADEMDKWIRHVSRDALGEFVLRIANPQAYRIPSIMFSCQNLTLLDLTKCWLRPPSDFEGFMNLRCLLLFSVTVSQDVLECLVSGSDVLEVLVLRDINGLSTVHIDAPNLLLFDFAGNFVDIRLENTTPLQLFYMDTINAVDEQNAYLGNFDNLVEFLGNAPQISKLCIQRHSFEHLAKGTIPRQLPEHCVDLDLLSITVNLTSCDETAALLCILRSAPNLQKLQIYICEEVAGETSSNNVWEAEKRNFAFAHLRYVMVGYFDAANVVGLSFVKFMLSTTPVLETMLVFLKHTTPADVEVNCEEAKQLLSSLERVSPTANIICE